MAGYCPAGLPHSEIPGSKPVCGSPRLIAAYRVLHRLSAPRHPPCTLSSLTKLVGHYEPNFGLLDFLFLDSQRILSLLTRFSCQRSFWISGIRATFATAAKEPRIPEMLHPASGGADRTRTDDIRLAKAALYQLSYSPVPDAAAGPPRMARLDGGPR